MANRDVLRLGAVLVALEVAEALAGSAGDALYVGRVGTAHLGGQLAASSALLVLTLGVIGVLADRVARARLLTGVATVSAVVMATLAALLLSAPGPALGVILIVTKQLAAAGDLALWVLVAERLDARVARRLMPRLLALGALGMLAGSLAVAPLGRAFGLPAVLLVAALVYALSAVLGSSLIPDAPLGAALAVARAAPRAVLASWWRGQGEVRQRELPRRLALVAALAAITGPLLHGALLAAARAAASGEAGLAGTLADARAIACTVTLALQLVVAPRLLARLGVRGLLVLAPLVLLLATLPGVLLFGLPWAVAAWVTARVVDAALHGPAEKLALHLVALAWRGRVGALVEGVAKRAGAVLGGGVLAAATSLGPVALVGAIAGATVVWLVAALRLGARYGALAVGELASGEVPSSAEVVLDAAAVAALGRALAGGEADARSALARVDDAAAREALLMALAAGGPAVLWTLLAERLPPQVRPRRGGSLAAGAAHASDTIAWIRVCARLGDEVAWAGACGAAQGEAEGWAVALGRAVRDGRAGEVMGKLAEVLGDRGGTAAGRGVDLVAMAAAEVVLRRQSARPEGVPEVVALQELALFIRGAADGAGRDEACAWLVDLAGWGVEERRATALAVLVEVAEREPLGAATAEARVLARRLLDERPTAALPMRLLAAVGEASDAQVLAAGLDHAEPRVSAAPGAALERLGAAALPAVLSLAEGARGQRGALELLRRWRVPAPAEERTIDSELLALAARSARRRALLGLEAPAARLLVQRLAERADEAARALVALSAARLGDRRVGALVPALALSMPPRTRARALEALDALMPRALARRLVPTLEIAVGVAAATGSAMSAGDALRAELAAGDPLAAALALRCLATVDGGARAPRRSGVRAALAALEGDDLGLGARLLRRLAAPDDDVALEMPGPIDTLALLRGVPILAALGVRELAQLGQRVRWRALAAGDSLGGGDDPRILVVVASGRVQVGGEDGHQTVLGAGGHWGEGAWLGASPGLAGVVAIEAAMIGVLDRHELEAVVDAAPRVGLLLAQAALGSNKPGV
jgi:hypothetical protein